MTVIMGVVNVTPDSFSDGGRFLDPDAAVAHAMALREAGADLLDVGGESTRPGSDRVEPDEERRRVLPVVSALAQAGLAVSVDTMNASTAVAAVEAGAVLVNDVSGGLADEGMLAAVAASGADIALGHWRGHSSDMYARAVYGDVVREVVGELAEGSVSRRRRASRPPASSWIPASASASGARRTGSCCAGCPASPRSVHDCSWAPAASASSPRRCRPPARSTRHAAIWPPP